MTPFWAARMITGSASLSAAWALVRSPVAIASSILTTAVRRRERRDLLTIVRRAIWRVALRAELVLAIRFHLCICKRQDQARRGFALLIEAARRGVKAVRRSPSGHTLHSDAIIARDCGHPVGRCEGSQRRLDARPGRIAMDVGKGRFHAGHELLAIEQLADGDRSIKRCGVATFPRARAQV